MSTTVNMPISSHAQLLCGLTYSRLHSSIFYYENYSSEDRIVNMYTYGFRNWSLSTGVELYDTHQRVTMYNAGTYPLLTFKINQNLKYKKIKSAKLHLKLNHNGYNGEVVFGIAGVYTGSYDAIDITPANVISRTQLRSYDDPTSGVYSYIITRDEENAVFDITSQFNSCVQSGSTTKATIALTFRKYNDPFNPILNPQLCVPPNYLEIENGNSYVYGKGSAYEPYIEITYDDVTQPAPTPLFPKDVYSREGEPVTFQWQFSSSTGATQKSIVLSYKLESAGSFTDVTINSSSARSYTINGLAPGSYVWKVKCTNDADEQSAYSGTVNFTVIGKPSVPVINAVENKSLVNITWNSVDQNSFELLLKTENGDIIERVSEGTDASSYRPNMFLPDGNYNVDVRYRNSGGYWSDWGSGGFRLATTKPDTPTASVMTEETCVTVTATTADSFAIMRKHGDVEEVLAMNENNFVDRTAIPGVEYGYFVRAYDEGYSDSEVTYVTISFSGAILNGFAGEVHLRYSSEKYAKYNESYERTSSIINYIGREYPLTEKGTYSSKTISREYVVSAEEKAVIEALANENIVFYRDTHGNGFPVSIVRTSYAAYVDMGYTVSIDMVRTSKDEVKINV